MKKIFSMFILLTIFGVCLGQKVSEPITKYLSVQSPILSGSEGQLTLPYDWLYAHVECVVINSEINDPFSVVTVIAPNWNRPQVSNLIVDGVLMTSDYFELKTPATHIIQFDISGNQYNPAIPLPANVAFYNGSTDTLNFSNCTATSQ